MEALNSGHFVEALERLYITSQFLETISNHEVFTSRPELLAKWNQVKSVVADMYQDTGKYLDEFEDLNVTNE